MEVFILIAFLDGHQAAAGYEIDFNSKDTCEEAKVLIIKEHEIEYGGWQNVDKSWVICVKK